MNNVRHRTGTRWCPAVVEARVDSSELRRTIARTRLAPLAAFPARLRRVARHDVRVLRASARWLVTSREHHNYTYDLTPLSREHLAWFVATVCEAPVTQVRAWFDEIESDEGLRTHLEQATAAPSVTHGASAGTRSCARAGRGTSSRRGSTRAWAAAYSPPPCCATPPRATRAG
jgi:hypothetical protein